MKTMMIIMFPKTCDKMPKQGKFTVFNKHNNQQNVARRVHIKILNSAGSSSVKRWLIFYVASGLIGSISASLSLEHGLVLPPPLHFRTVVANLS